MVGQWRVFGIAAVAGLLIWFGSAVESSVSFASVSQESSLDIVESRIEKILSEATGSRARSVMYRCYQFGRLQAVADQLKFDLAKLSKIQTANPTKQAQTIYEGQQIHLQLDTKLKDWSATCDAQFASANANSLLASIRDARSRLMTVGGEDPVVGCYHAGRLKIHLERLQNQMNKLTASGKNVKPEIHSLLTDSLRLLKRSCD